MATQVSVALNVNVVIDKRDEFNKLVNIYCQVMNKSMSLVVKNTARLFCKDMVQYTPPFSHGNDPSSAKGAGMDSLALESGQKKVSKQIRRIFAPIAQAHASQVAQYGNLGVFSAWMKAKEELPGRHEPYWVFQRWGSHRGLMVTESEFNLFQEWSKNGGNDKKAVFWNGTSEEKVKGLHENLRGKPMYKVKAQNQKVYVDDWKVVERYIKRVQTRVGKLKSGWYAAGKQLGKMPPVAWIEKQGTNDALCIPKLTGNKPMITVGTHGRERYRRWWPLMQMALNHRGYAMRYQILQHLKDPKNHGTLRQVIAQMPQGFNQIETKD
jgi:hypothetical protein